MTNYNLIIPDIHQNIDRLNQILSTEDAKNAKEIIFLGDYFDSFDYDFNTKEMCNFLNKNALNSRYTFLIGNHDQHYICDVKEYICSGYTREKKNIIKKLLSKDTINKFKPFKYEKIAGKHFLFSHAGLHPSFVPVCFDELLKNDSVKEWFANKEEDIKDSLFMNVFNVMLAAGWDRGGKEEWGGITWMDWRELIPIPGLNQVVGHSEFTKPQWMNRDDSINLNLDTNLKYYGLLDLDTGEIEVAHDF